MKKIIACISLVFAMSAGVTALAADATYSDDATNTVTMDATGYTTVLIEDAEENILFVDQNDSGLGSAAKFLLKGTEKLADGTYTVKLGGSSTAASTSTTFTVSSVVPVNTPVEVMGKEVNEETGSYAMGCKATATLDNAAYVVLTITNKDSSETNAISYSTGWSGEGEANIAIKIADIPSNYDVTVGLSNLEQ